MRAEISEAKFISEKKLTDARALEANLEEKQLQIELRLHAADARLAEANRKNSEMDRNLADLESREHKVQRELTSLLNEYAFCFFTAYMNSFYAVVQLVCFSYVT